MVTLVFVILASGLFWLDTFRSYRAEMKILVIGKSEKVLDSRIIAANLAEIGGTLAFAERVFVGDEWIEDFTMGYAPDQRKKRFLQRVSVRLTSASGVLVIRAQGENPEQAKRLARQVARTLFETGGFYYNVKTEIDMRVIDGPFVATIIGRPLEFGATSVLTGLVITVVFFFILKHAPRGIGRRQKTGVSGEPSMRPVRTKRLPEKEYAPGETVPWLDPKKFIPTKQNVLPYERLIRKDEDRFRAPDVQADLKTRSAGRAAAPPNLPTLSLNHTPSAGPQAEVIAALPFAFEETSAPVAPTGSGNPVQEVDKKRVSNDEPRQEKERDLETAPRSDEPTVEEYKRRLNALLSGS